MNTAARKNGFSGEEVSKTTRNKKNTWGYGESKPELESVPLFATY